MDILTYNAQKWVEDEENILKHFADETIWDTIPLLNVNELHHLQDGRLVRFRGMIQDMYSPEYYLEKFEVVNQKTDVKITRNGKYCDAAITNEDECVNFDSNSNITAERHTYVIISVPGINDWVNSIEKEQYEIKNELKGQAKPNKRSFEETMDSDYVNEPTGSSESKRKTCIQNNPKLNDRLQILSQEHILNFPLPNRTGKSCHLKIYKNHDELQLNDVCEFVGFLAMDPITESAYQDTENYENKMEMETLHPPSSLVPRIHCVTFRKLKHNNPLLHSDSDLMGSDKLNFIHKELLILLTQLLLGDNLAAEYLIFHLMSEVYMRRDFMPLGKFSLNISNIPKLENFDYVSELYKFIEMLVPKSHYLPMTLENMNDLAFTPKKDYECNRLTSGMLQLSSNTHIVLDETKLCPGKLNASGLNTVKSIANIVKNQKVVYDFKYYPLEFDCDIPFFILSEGKSLVNSDTHVVLKPEPTCVETFGEIIQAARHFLKPELLNDIRKYLTLARLTKYEITSNVEELVQREFVNMRQRGAVSADDLHGLLVLARLVSISEGKIYLDEECWKKACELERERKARIVK